MLFRKQTFGQFYLPENIAYDFTRLTELHKVLSKVLIVRAELMAFRRAIEYHGYSELFEEVPTGRMPFRYELMKAKPKINEYYISEYETQSGEVHWSWYLDRGDTQKYEMNGYHDFARCHSSAFAHLLENGFELVRCQPTRSDTWSFVFRTPEMDFQR